MTKAELVSYICKHYCNVMTITHDELMKLNKVQLGQYLDYLRKEQKQKLVDNEDEHEVTVTLCRGHHIRNADGTIMDVSNNPKFKCKED